MDSTKINSIIGIVGSVATVFGIIATIIGIKYSKAKKTITVSSTTKLSWLTT